ncbi:MAG: hypothetical protein BWY42_01621 [Candidatus Omnitrophica bacterium ADurb.Bin277]|nr:MAG: hypothetical protein BWY42_01621 [Candidatus Omnitrophica bacterium ADurb.Bin277]
MIAAILADIIKVKPLGEVHVKLDRPALKCPADRILQMEIDLGPVKRSVRLVNLVRKLELIKRVSESLGRDIPLLIGTYRFRRPRRKLDMIIKTKGFVYLFRKADGFHDSRLEALRSRKNMRVILGKPAHPEKTGKNAGSLVAVDLAEFRHLERQFAIRMFLFKIHQHAARTVHRLDRVALSVTLKKEHVLPVVIHMPGSFPEFVAKHGRRFNLEIAVSRELFPHELYQKIFEKQTFRTPERKTGTFLMKAEKTELFSDLAVVPLLRLFSALQVIIEIFLGEKSRPVNSLEHGIILTAPPIRPRHRKKPEGFQLTGVRHMPAAAKIRERTVLNKIDRIALDPFNDLEFVWLIRKERPGLGLAHRPLPECLIRINNLPHFFFDLREVLFLESRGTIEIIIKPFINHGPDGKFCSGIKLKDRLSKNVGGRMPEPVDRLVLFSVWHDYIS